MGWQAIGKAVEAVGKGAQTAGEIGGIAGLFRGRKWHAKTQNVLNEQAALTNYKYGKMAVDDERAYEDPKRQVERLKAAGLNPALMYTAGIGTTGVTETAATGGADAGNSAAIGQSMAAAQQQALSAALLNSQRKNIDAKTKLTEAKVPQTEAETNQIKSLTGLIKEQTKTQGLETEGKKITNSINSIANDIANATKEIQIKRMEREYDYLLTQIEYLGESLVSQKIENKINSESAMSIINKAYADMQNSVLDLAVKNAEIKLTNQKERLTSEQADIIKTNMDLEWSKLFQDQIEKSWRRMFDSDKFDNDIWLELRRQNNTLPGATINAAESVLETITLGKVRFDARSEINRPTKRTY